MRKFVLVISILTYVQNGAWGKNPGKIKVLDAKNSRLYRGPQNPERRDLSSYILRAKPTEPSIKYFTGNKKLHYFSIVLLVSGQFLIHFSKNTQIFSS